MSAPNRDEVIRLAKESNPYIGLFLAAHYVEFLQSFAALVAASVTGKQHADELVGDRVTPEMITAAILGHDFHVLPGTNITVCTIKLRNGYRVLGYNYGDIDPERHDRKRGEQAAYEMAREKIWELEGYALRERLAAAHDATESNVAAIVGAELIEQLAAAQVENKRLLSALEGLVGDVRDLVGESHAVAGLHMNGDLAPWDELLPGGRFERLAYLDVAEALITEKNLQRNMTDAKLPT